MAPVAEQIYVIAINPLFGMVVGFVVTILVSRWYYQRAGADMDHAIEALTKQTDVLVRLSESIVSLQGQDIRAERDSEGRLTGALIHNVRCVDSVRMGAALKAVEITPDA